MVFGSPWRLLRDNCHNLQQCLQLCPSFLYKVCAAWGLPTIPGADTSAVHRAPRSDEPQEKQQRTCKWQLDDLPSDHGHMCPKLLWGRHSQNFAFVVDCKPVADIVNGKCPLRSPGPAPMFERMTDRIVRMSRFESPRGCRGPCTLAAEKVQSNCRLLSQLHHGGTARLATDLSRDSAPRCERYMPLRWRQAKRNLCRSCLVH